MNALLGLAMLVVWPLVQVPLLLYLARRVEFSDDDAPDPREYVPTVRTDDGGGEARDAPEDATLCHRCGTANAPSYDYCQNCVADLSMGGPYSPPA